jgi:uncharacterized cupin superfamily protein
MSQMTVVHQAPTVDLAAAGQRPEADSGDPQLSTLAVAPAAAGNIGVWECQRGGWPVVDRPDTEVAYILSGTATLTDDATGTTEDISAGSLVVLPQGWTGRWDVTETVRKVYAIY